MARTIGNGNQDLEKIRKEGYFYIDFSIQYAGRSDMFEVLSIWQDEKYCKIQGTFKS